MKSKLFAFSFMLLLMGFSVSLFGQYYGNGNLEERKYDVGTFNKIAVSGNFQLIFIYAPEHTVYVETDNNLFEHIDVKVEENTLILTTSHIRKHTKMTATVTSPDLAEIEAAGASKVDIPELLRVGQFKIKVSGASNMTALIEAQELTTDISGASRLTLNGTAEKHTSEISGAARLNAADFKTTTSNIVASGASDAKVWATETLYSKTSGAAKVKFDKEPNQHLYDPQTKVSTNVRNDQFYTITDTRNNGRGDSVSVKIGNLNIKVIDDDSTKISVGTRTIVIDDNGNINITRIKKHRFNGHWAGVEIGLNGLLTPDFNMSYPASQSYLDQRMEKSINLNLNFYEQNIKLNKSGTIGMFSGLGLSWNNYRFSNSTLLTGDSSIFKGYLMEGVSVRKSKLTNLYLTLPLFFEVQSKSYRNKEKLHFAAGVVAGWRISSHTKIYYNEANKVFKLRDPETGNLLAGNMQSPGNSNRNISKNYDSFHMRPFKLDAGVRMGWGIVNLYANYSLTSLFIKDKGPELYPFAIGIAISSW